MQKPDRLLRSFWKRQIKNSEETNKGLRRDKYRSIEANMGGQGSEKKGKKTGKVKMKILLELTYPKKISIIVVAV